MGRTDLYRHFDVDGNLLYVGISLSAVHRLSQHKEHSHWAGQIKRVEVESFDTREEALIAETLAIQSENPKHNLAKRKKHVAEKKSLPAQSASDIVERYVAFSAVYFPMEAAQRLRISAHALRKLIEDGKIGHIVLPPKPGLSAHGKPYNSKIAITGWQLIEYLEHLQGKMTP
jgi:hypothetical protein